MPTPFVFVLFLGVRPFSFTRFFDVHTLSSVRHHIAKHLFFSLLFHTFFGYVDLAACAKGYQ